MEVINRVMAVPKLKIDWDGERFLLTGATIHHKQGLLTIGGVKPLGRGSLDWSCPLRFAPIFAVVSSFDTEMTESAEATYRQLVEWTQTCLDLRTSVPESVEKAVVDALSAFGVSPKPGQVGGILHLATAGSAALFSGVGQGKSVQTAAAIALYGLKKAIVVCPPAVLYNWENEFSRFHLKCLVVEGTAAQREKILKQFTPDDPQILIMSYDVLKTLTKSVSFGATKLKRCDGCGGKVGLSETKCEAHPKFLNQFEWDVVVADEAHRLRDPHSGRWRAALAIRHNAKNFWPLTGTAVEESLADLWSLLALMDPVSFPSKSKFIDRYCQVVNTYYGTTEIVGINPLRKEEFERVTQWMWRRDFRVGGPAVVSENRFCHLSPKERRAYEQMAQQLASEVDGGVIEAENHLVKQSRLYQMAQAYCEIADDGDVRMTNVSSKLDLLMDTLQDFSEPLLLWFGSTQLLRLAEARIAEHRPDLRTGTIYGETSAKKRQELVDMFQAGDLDALLLQSSAMGEGVTLTRARVAIHVCRPWSLTKNTQSNARNDRYGSEIHSELAVVNLITKDTIEETRMPERLEEKTQVVRDVLGSI